MGLSCGPISLQIVLFWSLLFVRCSSDLVIHLQQSSRGGVNRSRALILSEISVGTDFVFKRHCPLGI